MDSIASNIIDESGYIYENGGEYQADDPTVVKYLDDAAIAYLYSRLNCRFKVVEGDESGCPVVTDIEKKVMIYLVKDSEGIYWPWIFDEAWKRVGFTPDLFNTKADKVKNATEGNLASLDSDGNIVDSGFSQDDLGVFIALTSDESASGYATPYDTIMSMVNKDVPVVLYDNEDGGTGLYAELNCVGEQEFSDGSKKFVQFSAEMLGDKQKQVFVDRKASYHVFFRLYEGSKTFQKVYGESGYVKPVTGIPYSDLEDSVKDSLDKADTSIQGVSVNGHRFKPSPAGVVDLLVSGTIYAAGEAISLDNDQISLKYGHGLSLNHDNEIEVDLPNATQIEDGLMSKEDKGKLDGIAPKAQVNVIESISVNGTTRPISNKKVDIPVPVAGTAAPKMDGTAAVGTSGKFAREDHVHPTDTTRQAKLPTSGTASDTYAINVSGTAEKAKKDASGNVISSTYATKSEVESGLAGKQNTIPDLGAIRSGAAKGATAVQPADLAPYATKTEVDSGLAGKQDKINDLSTIRSGAAKGATAVQPADLADYATKSDLNTGLAGKQDTISDLSTIRSGASKGATALQNDDIVEGTNVEIDRTGGKIKISAIVPPASVQADWAQDNPAAADYIKNKPDLDDYATKSDLNAGLSGKQDTISDLSTIRSGAAAGSTAVQPGDLDNYATKSDLNTGLAGKQDTISDLSTIRSGAAAGASAVQPSDLATVATTGKYGDLEELPDLNNYATQSDLSTGLAGKQDTISDLATIRSGASAGSTAVQPGDLSNYATQSDLSTGLAGKVDAEAGKGLSENDFTDAYKDKVDAADADKHTHSNKATLDAIPAPSTQNTVLYYGASGMEWLEINTVTV